MKADYVPNTKIFKAANRRFNKLRVKDDAISNFEKLNLESQNNLVNDLIETTSDSHLKTLWTLYTVGLLPEPTEHFLKFYEVRDSEHLAELVNEIFEEYLRNY